MNCEILDPLYFIILNGLVYSKVKLIKLEKRIEELEAKARDPNIVLNDSLEIKETTSEPNRNDYFSTQEIIILPTYRQTGLDEDIFQTKNQRS